MQHGLATDKAENPERPLSARGIDSTRAIARHLNSSTSPISKVFHSGKLRAQQTAEIIASEFGATVSVADHLSANDDVRLLAQQLDTDYALYVGHLPHLEKLVSFLITGKDEPSIIQYQNSAIACLQKSESLYQLRWYITPETLAI